MTDEEPTPDDAARPWWHGGAVGMPDVESLLGPEGMAAVGGVAEEALKLFVVMRERFVVPPAVDAAAVGSDAAAAPWTALLGQLASGAVKAVNEIAAAASDSRVWTEATGSPGPPVESAKPAERGPVRDIPVLPGDAAACSYCPICQAIALFRSVPMSTWQRLATSVVDVADAARDFAGAASAGGPPPVVVSPQGAAGPAEGTGSVEEFLRTLEGGPDEVDPRPYG